MRSSWVPALGLLLTSCGSNTDWYNPPVARRIREGPQPALIRPLISMNDPDAAAFFLRDIHPALQSGSWRWTGKWPALHATLTDTRSQTLVVDYAIPGVGLQSTGPVAIRIAVNDHLVGIVEHAKDGAFHYQHPVPPEWLFTAEANVISFGIDKTWTQPNDQREFGFILTRAGFVRK